MGTTESGGPSVDDKKKNVDHNEHRKKEKNSHKIFIVMLATLLPCLFSTMHEYTPLSVRFSPLGNVKAAVVISTSLVSKRFQ